MNAMCVCGKTIRECEHDKLWVTDVTGEYVLHSDEVATDADVELIVSQYGDPAEFDYSRIPNGATVGQVDAIAKS